MSGRSNMRQLIASVLGGVLITTGFWFGPEIYRQHMRQAPGEPPTIPRETETIDAGPVLRPPARQAGIDEPSPRAEDRYRENRAAVLARLRQTCEFWTSRANEQSGRIYRDRACREMREYAAQTRQAQPHIRKDAPAPGAGAAQAVPEVSNVYVRECSHLQAGSIDYRRCRAEESRRLKEKCRHYRQRDEWRNASAWCAAHENYHVVD